MVSTPRAYAGLYHRGPRVCPVRTPRFSLSLFAPVLVLPLTLGVACERTPPRSARRPTRSPVTSAEPAASPPPPTTATAPSAPPDVVARPEPKFAWLAVSQGDPSLWYTAVLNDGTVWSWSSPSADPSSLLLRRVGAITDMVQVAAAGWFACAVRRDGTVHCWAREGNGRGYEEAIPRAVAGVAHARYVAVRDDRVCALLEDRTVRCANVPDRARSGQPFATTAAPLEGATDVVHIALSPGRETVALTNGGVRVWQDGRSLIAEAGAVARANRVAACGDYSCALLRDGSATCWGWGQMPAAIPGVTGAVDINCVERSARDDEGGSSVATQGEGEACAVGPTGEVRCWTHTGRSSGGLQTGAPTDGTFAAVSASRAVFGWTPRESVRCVWSSETARCGNGAALALPTADDYARAGREQP